MGLCVLGRIKMDLKLGLKLFKCANIELLLFTDEFAIRLSIERFDSKSNLDELVVVVELLYG